MSYQQVVEASEIHTCDKFMSNTNYSLLLPINKYDQPDHRFKQSLERICNELGEDAIGELMDFASQSQQLQRNYARQGLNLALAVLHEADYLDRHHRFDEDNEWGYKSKVLRKQAQVMLERLGFSRTNAHKLVSTASWMVSTPFGKDVLKWFTSLTPSHLYELSRMSDKAYKAVKDEVTYDGWSFCTGQKNISVRRLEQIRRLYPKVEEVNSSDAESFQTQDKRSLDKLQKVCQEPGLETCCDLGQVINSSAATNTQKLQQFVSLAKSIDWAAIQECRESKEILASIPDILGLIRFKPCQ